MRVLLAALAVEISLKRFPPPIKPASSTFSCCQCTECVRASVFVWLPENWLAWGRYRPPSCWWGRAWCYCMGVRVCVCVSLRGQGGGQCLPLSLRCVTFAVELSPTNGALVEPYKENPAEVLLESAWDQLGTAGCVWSTSADVGRMSTASLPPDDHSQSTGSRGLS